MTVRREERFAGKKGVVVVGNGCSQRGERKGVMLEDNDGSQGGEKGGVVGVSNYYPYKGSNRKKVRNVGIAYCDMKNLN